MKQLFVIQSTELDRIWNDVKPLIEKGLVTCDGEITIDQIRMCLVQGGMKLLVSQDQLTRKLVAALVVEVIPFPNYRCVNVVSIGGQGLGMDGQDVEQLKVICKQWGATKIQGYTHNKMTQYLLTKGFEKKYDVVRIDI